MALAMSEAAGGFAVYNGESPYAIAAAKPAAAIGICVPGFTVTIISVPVTASVMMTASVTMTALVGITRFVVMLTFMPATAPVSIGALMLKVAVVMAVAASMLKVAVVMAAAALLLKAAVVMAVAALMLKVAVAMAVAASRLVIGRHREPANKPMAASFVTEIDIVASSVLDNAFRLWK